MRAMILRMLCYSFLAADVLSSLSVVLFGGQCADPVF